MDAETQRSVEVLEGIGGISVLTAHAKRVCAALRAALAENAEQAAEIGRLEAGQTDDEIVARAAAIKRERKSAARRTARDWRDG